MIHFLVSFVLISTTASIILTALCTTIIYAYIIKKTRLIEHKGWLAFTRKGIPIQFVQNMLIVCAAGIIFGSFFCWVAPFIGFASDQFSAPYFWFGLCALAGFGGGWINVKNGIEIALMNVETQRRDKSEDEESPGKK
jgi:hypothetical protein